jgi:hypothetical protein
MKSVTLQGYDHTFTYLVGICDLAGCDQCNKIEKDVREGRVKVLWLNDVSVEELLTSPLFVERIIGKAFVEKK